MPPAFRGETLGVLAVFVRGALSTDEQRWLGLFADGAAIALASARALSDVERLKRELETENLALRDELTPHAETLIGESGGLASTMRQVDLVAKTDVAFSSSASRALAKSSSRGRSTKGALVAAAPSSR